jgi:putative hydrolase of HD superfamily
MNQSQINQLLNFFHQAANLKSTLRHNWTASGRQESSAEHSWSSALLFMILKPYLNVTIKDEKVLKMLIIHDLGECIHGDIPGFIKDSHPQKHKNHKDREAKAVLKLFSLLPQKTKIEFLDLYQELEEQITIESKLVKALEKVETMLQHWEAGISTWNESEKQEHMLKYPETALNKIKNPVLNKFWQEVLKKIKTELKKENP